MANDQDTFHADLCELLTILGMGDPSRPYSPHEVFQEALGVLRERLSLPATTPTSPCLGEREAVARTERPGFNFIDLELRCDERADMPEEISPDTLREAAAAIRQLRRERHELEAEDTRLRTEIKTLQTQRDAAKNEVTELCRRVDQMNRDWAAEGIEWLRSSDIDRLQGAEARALTAEAEREQSEKHRNDLMDSIVSLKTERGALKSRLAAVEDDREAALVRLETAPARAERAEEEACDARYKAARYKADCEEIDEHGALSHAEEADAEIDRLTAELAQAEGEIATMRSAVDKALTEWTRPSAVRLMVGEMMSAQEAQTADAVAKAVAAKVRQSLTTTEPPHGD